MVSHSRWHFISLSFKTKFPFNVSVLSFFSRVPALCTLLSSFRFLVLVTVLHRSGFMCSEMQYYTTNWSENILRFNVFFISFSFLVISFGYFLSIQHSYVFRRTFFIPFHSIHFQFGVPRFPSWSYYKCFPSKILFELNLFSPDFYERRYTFTNGIFR